MQKLEPGKHSFPTKDLLQETRLDSFLAERVPYYSRSFFKKLIEDGLVMINGKVVLKGSWPVRPGDNVSLEMQEQSPEVQSEERRKLVAQLQVRLMYETADFIIVDKPAGLVVHAPSEHSQEITLVDWAINHFHDIKGVGPSDRPGIVHRLDKETSGLMIITRTTHALMIFSDMFKERAISKTYLAVVKGHPMTSGTIEYPIARHPMGNKMTHRDLQGRPAVTHYRVQEYFKEGAVIEAKPVTGRTHQIRVHFAGLGHPLLGDALYGSSSHHIDRHALHAHKLAFEYQGKEYSFESPLPEDMQKLIATLKS